MRKLFNKFAADETGAVTVDWVVLCAAVVGLGILATLAITQGATNLSDEIWAFMDAFVAGG